MPIGTPSPTLNRRQSGDNLVFVFLDWEKAFDKVNHERMLEALDRMSIPKKLQTIIKDMYNKATFKVTYEGNESNTKRQSAGIRQGCPLSPVLFILVMTVMFNDIQMEVDRDITKHLVNGTTFAEVLYADDTMLVTQDTKSMHRILHAIEKESA